MALLPAAAQQRAIGRRKDGVETVVADREATDEFVHGVWRFWRMYRCWLGYHRSWRGL
jgi:hypothetical protein